MLKRAGRTSGARCDNRAYGGYPMPPSVRWRDSPRTFAFPPSDRELGLDVRVYTASGERGQVPRKKQEPVGADVARRIGASLRDLRRAAGYRAVRDAARHPRCPAAQQTIYAYERGGLVPSLRQLMELVEFYALHTEGAPREVRYQAIAVVLGALSSPAYHLPGAIELMARLQPQPAPRRARRRT